jgi:cytochrome b pre-mRNA-processing protein 3
MELLKSLFGGRKGRQDIVDSAYASVMNQALQAEFFGDGKLSDSFSGRFEIVSLHAAILFRRLRECDVSGRELSQAVFKEMFSGFDDALREVGTSDTKVGKKVREIGESFYGRAQVYDAALNEKSETDLESALERNLTIPPEFAKKLAGYVLKLDESLKTQADDELLRGEIAWISPSNL